MRAGVLALCLVQFTDVLGVTVVVTALPAMLADLHARPQAASLIATGYAMFFGGLLMLGARLGDRFGHRRVILAALVLFGIAAAVGATATSVLMLTAARCLQGAAAAMSVPSALRLLTTITPEGPRRRSAIALWSAAGAAAGASGFVVGGIVTEVAGWRGVFWAFLVIAAVLAAAIARAVPPDRLAAGGPTADRPTADRPTADQATADQATADQPTAGGPAAGARQPPAPLSLASAGVFTAAAMMLVVALSVLPEPGRGPLGAVLLGLALILAGIFAWIDRRSDAPLLPAGLLRQRPLRQGAAGSLLNTMTTSSAITLATLFLQGTRGRSPLSAGLMLMPFSIAAVAGSALAAPALARWSPRRVIAAGLTAIALSDALLIPAAGSAWALPADLLLGGAGIGLSSVAANGLGTSVRTDDRGTAAGILNTAAQLGTALGIAVLLLVAALTTGVPGPDTAVPAVAWGLASAISLGGAALFARRSDDRRDESTTGEADGSGTSRRPSSPDGPATSEPGERAAQRGTP